MRQAARALLRWPSARPVVCDVSFSRFVELAEACEVRAEVTQRPLPGVAELAVRLMQEGATAAEGTVTLAE